MIQGSSLRYNQCKNCSPRVRLFVSGSVKSNCLIYRHISTFLPAIVFCIAFSIVLDLLAYISILLCLQIRLLHFEMSDSSDEHSSADQSSGDDTHSRATNNGDDLDDLDYENEDDASGSEDVESDDDQREEEIDFSKLKLCPKHNPGEMRESCPNCLAFFACPDQRQKED